MLSQFRQLSHCKPACLPGGFQAQRCNSIAKLMLNLRTALQTPSTKHASPSTSFLYNEIQSLAHLHTPQRIRFQKQCNFLWALGNLSLWMLQKIKMLLLSHTRPHSPSLLDHGCGSLCFLNTGLIRSLDSNTWCQTNDVGRLSWFSFLRAMKSDVFWYLLERRPCLAGELLVQISRRHMMTTTISACQTTCTASTIARHFRCTYYDRYLVALFSYSQ